MLKELAKLIYWTEKEDKLFIEMTEATTIEERNRIFNILYPKFYKISEYFWNVFWKAIGERFEKDAYIQDIITKKYEKLCSIKIKPGGNTFAYVTQVFKNAYIRSIQEMKSLSSGARRGCVYNLNYPKMRVDKFGGDIYKTSEDWLSKTIKEEEALEWRARLFKEMDRRLNSYLYNEGYSKLYKTQKRRIGIKRFHFFAKKYITENTDWNWTIKTLLKEFILNYNYSSGQTSYFSRKIFNSYHNANKSDRTNFTKHASESLLGTEAVLVNNKYGD